MNPHSQSAGSDAYAAAPSPISTHTALGPIEHTDTGKGPALLTLHGGMGGYDQSWLLARSLLSELNAFRVMALSRPGYLGTPQYVGRTPEQQADALVALLDRLGIERVFVGAVSAGGPAALSFALRHTDRCRGLILVSAATGPLDVPTGIAWRLRMMRMMALIPGLPAFLRRKTENDPKRAARRSIADIALVERTLAHPQAGPLLRKMQSAVMHRMAERVGGTVNDIKSYRSMTDFRFDLLSVPTLIIHGSADRIVPVEHGRAVAEQALGARFHPIEGAEHVVIFTHLDEVRQVVEEFLRRHV